jgi:hypothetical protein
MTLHAYLYLALPLLPLCLLVSLVRFHSLLLIAPAQPYLDIARSTCVSHYYHLHLISEPQLHLPPTR